MSRLFTTSSLIALTATIFLSMTGTASASLEVHISVGCDYRVETPEPSHECEIGDEPDGYLEVSEALFYDFCTEHPNGETVCEEDQYAAANALYGNIIHAKEVGQYHVTWWHHGAGTVLGTWAFTMRPAGSPPGGGTTTESPGIIPPPPAPVVTPPAPGGPSAACLAAKARTKVLSAKLKKAGKKKKPKIRAKLRKARAGAASAC
jgi:hypothetical protein